MRATATSDFIALPASAGQGQNMSNGSVSVWEKFDFEEYKQNRVAVVAEKPSSADAKSEGKASRWDRIRERFFWLALNAMAAVFWVYVPIKLFVGDLDRWIVSQAAPSLLWAVRFRFFLLLSIFTLVVLLTKHKRNSWVLLYVFFYPGIVLFWKLPRMFYRSRNWNLVIGTVQVLWSLGMSFRFGLVALTVFVMATLAISLDAASWVLWGAVVALLALWVSLVTRAVIYAIVPSKFVVHQKKILGAILDSEDIWNTMASLPSAAKSAEVARLSKDQIDTVLTHATMGLVLYGGSAFWAEKLDQYRKSGTSVVFSAFAVVALVAQAAVIFTLVNLAIYRIDESEFAFPATPHLLTFGRYAFTSMYAGEIEALRPIGTAASAISILEGFSCAVIVLVLVVSVIFSLKQAQDDRVAEASIQDMRRKADSFAEKLSGEYNLPLMDLIDRMMQVGGIFGNWIRQVSEIASIVRCHSSELNEHKREAQ